MAYIHSASALVSSSEMPTSTTKPRSMELITCPSTHTQPRKTRWIIALILILSKLISSPTQILTKRFVRFRKFCSVHQHVINNLLYFFCQISLLVKNTQTKIILVMMARWLRNFIRGQAALFDLRSCLPAFVEQQAVNKKSNQITPGRSSQRFCRRHGQLALYRDGQWYICWRRYPLHLSRSRRLIRLTPFGCSHAD